MRHAFCIIAHHQFAVLKMLVSLLNNMDHDIFIHIDKKTDCDIETLRDELKAAAPESMVCVYQEIKTYWGHSSQVDCIMLLLKIANKHGGYGYYHMLSGVDLPIKTSKYIHDFFERNRECEFVRFEAPQISEAYLERVDYYHIMSKIYKRTNCKAIHKLIFWVDRSVVLLQKAFAAHRLSGVTCQKGDGWFSVTEPFIEYLLTQEFFVKRLVSHTCCADEIFLQTVLYNSPFVSRLYNKNFDNNPESHCREIIFNGIAPVTFTIKDRAFLMESKQLFARKFDEKDPFTWEWYKYIKGLEDNEK